MLVRGEFFKGRIKEFRPFGSWATGKKKDANPNEVKSLNKGLKPDLSKLVVEQVYNSEQQNLVNAEDYSGYLL